MRRLTVLALGTALATTGLALAVHAAPAKAPAADPTVRQPGWSPPKNAFGQPDLSGYWSNATMTPLFRNVKLTPGATMDPKDAQRVEKIFSDALAEDDKPTDPNETTEQLSKKASESALLKIRPEFKAAGGDVGGYNAAWIDPGSHIMEVNGEYRTSILTTPDGQIPKGKDGKPINPYAGYGRDTYDSYETRSLGERCIMGFGRNAGPPMLSNGFYNNDYYIIQTADTVAIQIELIHDTRIVRLGGKHRTDGVRPWMGDSIGRWDGDTLVVETTNIPKGEAWMGSWKNLKVTEWFTRVSPTRIDYRFQVEDPDTWDKPWGGEYDFSPMKGVIYEYACHEGNYALPSILAGARRQEKEAAEAAATKVSAPAPSAAGGKGGPGGR
ncbi:MAG: hypothetical protein E7812_03875 [Phenylobacterium sp.]|nr:MAG: hypothetical protein E7812_03875 [Phenylobacterium sp.]